MRNEKWGWWIIGIFLVTTFALTGVIQFLLPRGSEQWTGAAMAAWILAGSLTAATLRAPHCEGNRFWPIALFSSATLSWFTMYLCANHWNLTPFSPNSAMLTIFLPVSAPSGIQAIRISILQESLDKSKLRFKGYGKIELVMMYVVAVAHLILCFDRATLSTKLFLAFFAIVSIAAWRMPEPPESRQEVSRSTDG